MRERLIAAFIALTITVVGLYGIPRAYIVAEQVQVNEERKVERSLALVAILIAERQGEAAPVTEELLTRLLNEGERYTYRSGGREVAAGPALTGNSYDISMSLPVDGGGELTLERSGELIRIRVSDAVMPVVLIGLGLILLSAGAAFLLAQGMSRPFRELAVVAERLGTGRFDVTVPHYKVLEAEEIAFALRSSSAALQELIRREQEFAANASHQLRTPITALRLELEDLALWPETPAPVTAELNRALKELDRLTTAISELLELARGKRLSSVTEINIAALARDAVERWSVQAKSNGRPLQVAPGPLSLPAKVPPGPVSQILDVLIENALKYGVGTIIVTAADSETHLHLSVSDQGVRPKDNSIFGRTVRDSTAAGEGIGLAVASELAEAIGGHLALGSSLETAFNLLLPRSDEPGAEISPAEA
ncbi:signal transduction histidine kinase [Rhodoglobus vestalii]|uniref:histidine kinase n=1 Tax=Rhodoglobus vestalii TaxID=193384 RepID=A0A8H2PXV2_9MICO|nr:HAMP domain-containing sensor histidine kinase [Rhodoglobus vestalii]TQO20605.1 signal transduction histidine kinase [Rhodoglobus vestalii]